jgi:hypothetical protein
LLSSFEVDIDVKQREVWRWKRIAERFQGTNYADVPNPSSPGER